MPVTRVMAIPSLRVVMHEARSLTKATYSMYAAEDKISDMRVAVWEQSCYCIYTLFPQFGKWGYGALPVTLLPAPGMASGSYQTRAFEKGVQQSMLATAQITGQWNRDRCLLFLFLPLPPSFSSWFVSIT